MTDLLNKIKGVDRHVAKVLQEAGLRSDSDIRSLTRAELHQLLPGKEDLKLRRTIFEMIKQEPVGQLLREIKNFIPYKDFKAALTGNRVFVDYLCIMKDMQTQVKHIQSFQEAHIRFLEENIQNQPEPESATNLKEPLGDVPPQEAHGHSSDLLEEIRNRERGTAVVLREADLCSDSDIRSLTREELLELFPGLKNFKLRRRIFEMIQNQKPVKQLPPTEVNNSIPSKGSSDDRMDTNDQQPPPKEEPSKVVNKRKGKLVYQMVVTGTTLDAHVQLMEKVKNEVKDQFDLVQSNSDDYDVTIVFCPIVSCIVQDVESALRDVKGNKPVILVLMHHAYETKFIPNVQQGANVQLQVNIFFHATKHGLLHCGENGAVVCEITKYLKQIPITNAQVVATSWPHQTPSNQKPVKQPPSTGVNNGIPSKEPSKVVNKRKGKSVYQVVVTGTTFDAHVQLMEKVKNEVKDQFDLIQSNSDYYDVTIVFCPIVSRMGPDVESAMKYVKGYKPVILVLMHHAYEAKFIPNVQQGANVQLQVNVFFHKTKHGLLHCGENGAVVCEITKYLQEIPIPNAQVVAAGSSGKWNFFSTCK